MISFVLITAEEHILLNIGGIQQKDGWINVNAQPQGGVIVNMVTENGSFNGAYKGHTDVLNNMDNLIAFKNDSVSVVYASHVLEHASHKDTNKILLEWRRVLHTGGAVLISVPDLEVLFETFLTPKWKPYRAQLVVNIFGAHTDEFDYHKSGFR